MVLQFHLSSQRQHYYIELFFFKSFQGFTVLKQYFWQSDIFFNNVYTSRVLLSSCQQCKSQCI